MRRSILILLGILAAVLLAVLLLPFWLEPVLRLAADRLRADFDAYERIGYSRFVLTGVRVTQPGATIRVDRVESDTPLVWAGRRIGGGAPLISAGEWRVEVTPVGPRREPRPAPGWIPLRDQLLKIGSAVEQWVPAAEAGRGVVFWPGGSLEVDRATWRSRVLEISDLHWRGRAFHARAEIGRKLREIVVEGEFRDLPISGLLRSEGDTVVGEVSLWAQRLPVTATFAEAGWLPVSAQADADAWVLQGADVRLPKYATLRGDAAVSWSNRRFDVDVDVRGEPVRGSGVPELRVVAKAEGDRQSVRLQQLAVNGPGTRATLSSPVELSLATRTLSAPARFTFGANLAELPWFVQEGLIEGSLEVESRSSGWPAVTYRIRGQELAISDWALDSAAVSGELAWPRLIVETATVAAGPEGRAEVSGEYDAATRRLEDVQVRGNVPYEFIKRFVPEGFWFAHAEVAVKANGTLEQLHHEGTLSIDELEREGLQPAETRLWWKGTGRQVDEFEAGIRAADTEIVAEGSVRETSATLDKLVWRHAGEDRLALERPSHLAWTSGIEVDAFDLVGPAGELRLSGRWGPAGEARFFARGISAEWWTNFVPETPFGWSIDSLSLRGQWDNGPATFETDGVFSIRLEGDERVMVDLKARGDANGARVETLRAREGDTEMVQLSGQVPLAVRVAPAFKVELSRSAALEANGYVRPEARWWAELGDKTGVHLERPRLRVALGGSIDQPQGKVSLEVDRITMDERLGPDRWPTVERISAELVATPGRVELQEFSTLISGQPLTISGGMDLVRGVREKLREQPLQTLRDNAEIRVVGREIEVSAFSAYTSRYILPQGRVDVDVAVSMKSPWKGFLRMRDISTRPLGGLSPLRSIDVELTLDNRRVAVNRITGDFGGQPVSIQGGVDLSRLDHPRYDLQVNGDDLPFVRQAGLVIRGDVDLRLSGGGAPGEFPVVSGTVGMHDGLFVSDVRALIPSGGSGPARRPPYFSVSVPPFDRWRLDVSVEGERFLRARTTLFNGVASMKFKLAGNLGEPRALGVLRIDEGQVMFPFARFNLLDASVRLTEENPFQPQLAITGAARRYGYDLRLELTGSANEPNLEFSSSPPLNSEEVLLLVMAGQTPENEVSYSTKQRFTRLGTFFGQSLLSSLGAGGGDDRLTISSGERISKQGRETYEVEYELNDRWSVVGEYDEFDEYNAGIKWQLMPKSDTPSPSK